MTSLLLTLTLTGCLTKADPDADGRRAPTVDERTDNDLGSTDSGPPGDDTASTTDTAAVSDDTDTTDTTDDTNTPPDSDPPDDTGTAPDDLAPGIGDLVISELMPHPAAVTDADGEWIELTNVSGETLSLERCVLWQQPSFICELYDNAGDPVVIEPGAIITLCANPDKVTNGGVTCEGRYVAPEASSDCGLGNGGDTLAIECGERLIDAVEYSESQLVEGASLGVDPSAVDADDNDNDLKWCPQTSAMRDGDLGTPGAENDPCF